MDTFLVNVTQFAENQLREIRNYIVNELQAPDSANRFLDYLEKEFHSLSQLPQRIVLADEEPWHSEGIHKMVVKNFIYHFVINSVSFKDGLKYYDNKVNYKKIRKLSDDLYYKYQLSVIENPRKKSMHYAEWQAEKQHLPTWRSAIREDVDYAISRSMTMKQFFQHLRLCNQAW